MELSKFRFLTIILLVVILFCSSTVLAFTEEEQTEINEIKTTLANNSKNNGVTWQLGYNGSATRVALFQTDFIYAEQSKGYRQRPGKAITKIVKRIIHNITTPFW